MPECWDAVVIGAGPAGSSAAAILGESGRNVLLLDQSHFPREKTCGDGVTYKCRPLLQRLGLWDSFLATNPFETHGYALGFSDGSFVSLQFPSGDDRYPIYVLGRHDFDNLLLEGARRHRSVTFGPGQRVRRLLTERKSNHEVIVGVEAVDGSAVHEHHSRLVIDASGANSQVAAQVGAGNRDARRCALAIRGYYRNVRGLSDAIEIYFDPRILPGYYWIFPTSETTANVGCGTFQHIVREKNLDLRAILEEFRVAHPIVGPRLADAELCGPTKGGKIPLGIDASTSRVRSGLLLLGDAAAFVNPVTAEGISYAMESGIMAGEVAVQALDGGDCSGEGLRSFDERWQKAFASAFSKSAFLFEGLPQESVTGYAVKAIAESERIRRAMEQPGTQYELMVKLKCLMKFLT